MKVIDCTTQQAGDCADAIRKLTGSEMERLIRLATEAVGCEDGDRAVVACEALIDLLADQSARDKFALSDLLVALEDAERGVERSSKSPVATRDLGGEGG